MSGTGFFLICTPPLLRASPCMMLAWLPLLSACGDKARDAPSAVAPMAVSPATPRPLTDATPQIVKVEGANGALGVRVKQVLAKDGAMMAAGIDVTVKRGVAPLWGTVGSVAERQRAEALAGAVDGVTRVENRLLVLGSS